MKTILRNDLLNIDIHRTINLKVEDVITEDDEVLDKIIDQVSVQNKIFTLWNRTQVWTKADGYVGRVHLGFITDGENVSTIKQNIFFFSYLYCERSLRKPKRYLVTAIWGSDHCWMICWAFVTNSTFSPKSAKEIR